MDDRARVERLLAELTARMEPGVSSALTPDPVRAAEIVDALAPLTADDRRAVTRLVVNGRRVDFTVIAGDQEWSAVCSIDADGVHSAVAFEWPLPFDGVDGGRAVIVNGPSSVGKTTTMQAVLRIATTPWVAFDELTFGSVAMPFLIWPERAPSLRPGFVAGIAALAAAGNQVITTGSAEYSTLAPLRAAVRTVDVALDCPLDVRIERQAGRTDRWGGLTEETDRAHDGWTYDVRFDTSVLSPEEIAERILELVGG